MQAPHQQLLQILDSIEGTGAFAAIGETPFVMPGLNIEGVGEISLPLNEAQARQIIAVAHKAPFGKGSQTIVDTHVRSAWEIDAAQAVFRNAQWSKALSDMVASVSASLGVKADKVKASPYKLLLYEKGDFFLPHKDSEKEKGMFGTLVVGLPSVHEGGELLIRFDGREEKADFSSAAPYTIPYCGFYADCEHEIKPLRSGYRLCMVYNLVQTSKEKAPSPPLLQERVAQLREALTQMEQADDAWPRIYLTAHQYTPANFGLSALKGNDLPRVTALLTAAEQAGFIARLGLATHYQMGDLEVNYRSRKSRRGYRSRYDYEEDYDENYDDGQMGDIHEEYTHIEEWDEEQGPGLGNLDIDEDNLLREIDIDGEEPIEKEAEDYTGNAGMTMEYWYHYGAVAFWPESIHIDVLCEASTKVQLQWLDHYASRINDVRSKQYLQELALSIDLPADTWANKSHDYSPWATALVLLDDPKIALGESAVLIMEKAFLQIGVAAWVAFLERYLPDPIIKAVFAKVCGTGNHEAVLHLLNVLETLRVSDLPAAQQFVGEQTVLAPRYIAEINFDTGKKDALVEYEFGFHSHKEEKTTRKNIICRLLAIASAQDDGSDWHDAVGATLAEPLSRSYVSGVLAPALLEYEKNDSVLFHFLWLICLENIQERTAVKPQPPGDWRRDMPDGSKRSKEEWEILKPFMDSPVEQILNYKKNEYYRNAMSAYIERKKLDVRTETITNQGSPYTLRIIKTQKDYERALKRWEEDVQQLEDLKMLSPDDL